jgi:hypothetical protein
MFFFLTLFVSRMICKTNGLFLLPSGPGTVSISSLLYSKRAGELFRQCREKLRST